MKLPNASLGLDVGGSHVTAAVVSASFAGGEALHLVRKEIDSFGEASDIIASIAACVQEVLADEHPVTEIGIAFPGPFDYENGICTILNVGGKFEQMYGLNVGQALKAATELVNAHFRFFNDAHCFAVGAYRRNRLESKRTVFLTIGSGFGSSFMDNGRLMTKHPALPELGAYYNEPFRGAIADDYFSTRWFHRAYQQATGHTLAGVRELAGMQSDITKRIFEEFGSNLGEFLLPRLAAFECDQLVIGGNIARASHLFVNALENRLNELDKEVDMVFCEDTEACILTGAASLARREGIVPNAVLPVK